MFTHSEELLIHSSVIGCLDCFHIFAIILNAAMNICVHISFQIYVFMFEDRH